MNISQWNHRNHKWTSAACVVRDVSNIQFTRMTLRNCRPPPDLLVAIKTYVHSRIIFEIAWSVSE